jgi:hypothetical protein
MSLSPEAVDPIGYLERIARAPDFQTRQMIQDRDHVLREYGYLFRPDRLSQLSAEDFKAFLLYDNNRHWWGIHRHQRAVTSDMERLRISLGVLLDESRPIAERVDWIEPASGDKPVPGLGKAVYTPILHVVYPDRYGVWNSIAEGAMTRLGLWPSFPWGAAMGGRYESVNESLRAVSDRLGVDLWTVDALWWRVERDHEPTKHQFEGLEAGSPIGGTPVGRSARAASYFTCRVCMLNKASNLRSAPGLDVCVDCAP